MSGKATNCLALNFILSHLLSSSAVILFQCSPRYSFWRSCDYFRFVAMATRMDWSKEDSIYLRNALRQPYYETCIGIINQIFVESPCSEGHMTLFGQCHVTQNLYMKMSFCFPWIHTCLLPVYKSWRLWHRHPFWPARGQLLALFRTIHAWLFFRTTTLMTSQLTIMTSQNHN